MAWKKYTVTGFFLLLIWAVIFVSTMPMRFLIDQVPIPSQIHINALSGTLWSGRAEMIFNSTVPIINEPTILIWQWCPLQGILSMCLKLDNPSLKGNTHISYSLLDRDILVDQTVLQISIREQKFPTFQYPLVLSGSGEINIQELKFALDSSFPEQINADGDIKALRNRNLQIGDYMWKSEYKNNILETKFNGGTDDFLVEGGMDVEYGKNTYRYYANIRTESNTLFKVLKPYAQNSVKGKLTFSGVGKIF